LKADVYLAGDDELHAWAFERRHRLPLDDLTIWLRRSSTARSRAQKDTCVMSD